VCSLQHAQGKARNSNKWRQAPFPLRLYVFLSPYYYYYYYYCYCILFYSFLSLALMLLCCRCVATRIARAAFHASSPLLWLANDHSHAQRETNSSSTGLFTLQLLPRASQLRPPKETE